MLSFFIWFLIHLVSVLIPNINAINFGFGFILRFQSPNKFVGNMHPIYSDNNRKGYIKLMCKSMIYRYYDRLSVPQPSAFLASPGVSVASFSVSMFKQFRDRLGMFVYGC